MGNVMSGNRQSRVRKLKTTELPKVQLTHAEHYSIKRNQDTRVIPDAFGWATVRFQQREWPVELTSTALHFGGYRRWMLCPVCKRRKQTLYISCDKLACRNCLGLGYESQNESTRARKLRRIDKIRSRLGWQSGLLSPPGGKPKSMHWKTYAALRSELCTLTDLVLLNMHLWLNRAEEYLNDSSMQPLEPHTVLAA